MIVRHSPLSTLHLIAFLLSLLWIYDLYQHVKSIWSLPLEHSFFLFILSWLATLYLVIVQPNRNPPLPFPRWYIIAIGLLSMSCILWVMVFGSIEKYQKGILGGGAAGGEINDRFFHDHGKVLRHITEEEYQISVKWNARTGSAIDASISAVVLAASLYFIQVRQHRSQAQKP